MESGFYACDGKKVPYALLLDSFSLCIHVLKFLERLHSPNSRPFVRPLIPDIHKNSYIMWTQIILFYCECLKLIRYYLGLSPSTPNFLVTPLLMHHRYHYFFRRNQCLLTHLKTDASIKIIVERSITFPILHVKKNNCSICMIFDQIIIIVTDIDEIIQDL
jgi:hypothetical protein